MRHFTKGTLSLSIASLFSLATTSAQLRKKIVQNYRNTTTAPQAAKKEAEPAKTQQVEIKAQTEVEEYLGRKDATQARENLLCLATVSNANQLF